MIFFGITLLIALVVSFIRTLAKRKPFEAGAFAVQTIVIWVIVAGIAAALFVGWFVVALYSLGGGCFNC